MFVELHILQNFAPSNLNRDRTGSPKACDFGGVPRARISSQCWKRAIRTAFRTRGLLNPGNLGCRTSRLLETLVTRLGQQGKSAEEACRVGEVVLNTLGLSVKEDGRTEYMLFLGQSEIDSLARLTAKHWNPLKALVPPAPTASGGREASSPRKAGRDGKKSSPEHIPEDIRNGMIAVLDGGKAADVALFARWIANLPGQEIDAACQVAHAVSTHRVNKEIDFFTAVDDLLPSDASGAGHLDDVEFNLACFYRYMNVDPSQLMQNLDQDADLAQAALDAFITAAVTAVPTGKQNSMAAHNPPSFVMAVVRDVPWNLANAFIPPITASREGDLVTNSIRALDKYWGQVCAVHGEDGVKGKWVSTLDRTVLTHLRDGAEVNGAPLSIAHLRGQVLEAVRSRKE